jgi:2-C-methyl-D-erythritol 4-phosphate cytidylyltransferase
VEGVWSIVLAAGSGSRFGGNKQLAQLGDQRVVDWSVASAKSCCEGVVLVVNPQTIGESGIPQVDIVVPGGLTRSESVRKGLAVLPQSAEIVVIHDAARPGATIQMYLSTIEAVLGGADPDLFLGRGLLRNRGIGVIRPGFKVACGECSSLHTTLSM